MNGTAEAKDKQRLRNVVQSRDIEKYCSSRRITDKKMLDIPQKAPYNTENLVQVPKPVLIEMIKMLKGWEQILKESLMK